ncbi:hypothetical protein B0H14DRAFT_2569180 [Mycena olivaceomarginata]|nr:hypothetical protein B0H14DRAFT_2569180 [Mycena olivaceomarginata]
MPPTLFFPTSLQTVILDNLLAVKSEPDLARLLDSWQHQRDHTHSLYLAINAIATAIRDQRDIERLDRNAKARETRRAKRKRAEGTDEDDDEEDTTVTSRRSSRPRKRALLHISATDDEAEDSDSALPETLPLPWVTPIARTRPRSGRTKAVLQPVTNQPKAQRRAPSPLKKVAEVTQSYRPQYKPRVRR